jgi:hypothetical protein
MVLRNTLSSLQPCYIIVTTYIKACDSLLCSHASLLRGKKKLHTKELTISCLSAVIKSVSRFFAFFFPTPSFETDSVHDSDRSPDDQLFGQRM